MTTERDEQLGSALAELDVPEHGDGFWSDVDRALAGPAGAGVAGAIGAAGADAAGVAPATEPLPAPTPVPDGRRPRWRHPLALAAAAVLVVALAATALALVGGDDGVVVQQEPPETTTTTTEPTTTSTVPTTTTEPSTTTPPPPSWDPTVVASRQVLAPAAPAGSLRTAEGGASVLLTGPLPGVDPAQGCEGVPGLQGLVSIGQDGTTRSVTMPDGSSIRSPTEVLASPTGPEVAVVTRCDASLLSIAVGVAGPDGVPTDLEVVFEPGSGISPGQIDTYDARVHWTGDGTGLLVASSRGTGVSATPTLREYDLANRSWSVRDDAPAGVEDAVELADGTLVAVTRADLESPATLAVDGRDTGVEASRVRLAPGGPTALAFGGDGLWWVDASGPRRLLEGSVWSAHVLTDAFVVAVRQLDLDEPEVVVVPIAGGAPTAIGTGLEAVPLADGSGLLVTVAGPGPDEQVVERWTFARR